MTRQSGSLENIWVKLAQHWESNWLNIESQIGSTLGVKLTQHWESNWLNIESQVDSTLTVKLTQHWQSSWLNIESQVDSTLRVKFTQHWESSWLNIESQIEFNILQLLTLPGQIIVPPVTQRLKPKWLNFFSRCTEQKKLSHFDLKSCVEFWFRQWLDYLGQNDSFFLSVHWEKSRFDLKSWVIFQFRQWLKS